MRELNELRPWLDSAIAAYTEDIIYGFSDLGELLPSELAVWPCCVSIAVRMEDLIMDSVREGPTMPYSEEYQRVNGVIDELEKKIASRIEESGYNSYCIVASDTRDRVRHRGEFQHKTGAVRGGLGWIGRNCQLVTRKFGPRVRLGTVLTDMPLHGPSAAITRSFCGTCDKCVTACRAGALTGALWTPGIERQELFDPDVCIAWKKENFPHIPKSICGICTSVCPMGTVRNKEKKRQVVSAARRTERRVIASGGLRGAAPLRIPAKGGDPLWKPHLACAKLLRRFPWLSA